jgi:DNA mismatch repair protein MutS2
VPKTKKEEIELGLFMVTDARKKLNESGHLHSFPLDFIADIKEILKQTRLSAQEIYDCAKTFKNARLVKEFLQEKESSLLEFCTHLISNKAFEEKISLTFDKNLNVLDSASEELRKIRASLASQEKNLDNRISQLLSNPEFCSHLQDNIHTIRNNRTVFQVKATDKNKVQGIVHDVSITGQTFLIEPVEIVELGNTIQQLNVEIQAEIEKILIQLSEELHSLSSDLTMDQDTLTELDFIFAKAKYANELHATPAELSDKKIIKLQGAYHPLLAGIVQNIVKNDVEIGKDYTSLIITGANTGGKTVILKTVGLLTLMTMCEMHIPCLHGEIYPFKNVWADITQEQDILQSLSTFSAHTTNISTILKKANSDDLILFDELCQGTDPMEGAALAEAILTYLLENDILTITTTHLGKLKLLEYKDPKFKNASVEFDSSTLRPTYRLIIGVAGSSNALEIARNLMISENIINSAKEILSQDAGTSAEILERMQNVYKDWHEKNKNIDEKSKIIEKTQKQLEEKLDEIKEGKRGALDNFRKKYRDYFENMREEIKETVEYLKKSSSAQAAREAYKKLADIEKEIGGQMSKDAKKVTKIYDDVDWFNIKPGDCVLIKNIEQVGVLISMPDEKNNIQVQIGLMKATLKKGDVAKTNKKDKTVREKAATSVSNTTAQISNKIDLRGTKVQDAIEALDMYLDVATLKSFNEITVIHGAGSGDLRRAIREHLLTSPYVLKYRAGDRFEGGDGVTVITLK